MVFTFARVGAVIGMNVEDYYPQGKRWWLRLHEKGGRCHELPAHHTLEAYLDAYIATAASRQRQAPPLPLGGLAARVCSRTRPCTALLLTA